MSLLLPRVFDPDGPYADYERLTLDMLALLDDSLAAGTLITEWWDHDGGVVWLRLTLLQVFRFTITLDIQEQDIDWSSFIAGMNDLLLLIERPGHFAAAETAAGQMRVGYMV